ATAFLNSLPPNDPGIPAARAAVDAAALVVTNDMATVLADKTFVANDQTDIDTAQNAFASARNSYQQALNALELATNALIAAHNSALNQVDSLSDVNLSAFAAELQGVMNMSLTLPATISSDLDVQFLNANTARTNARILFIGQLVLFQSLQ